ncbi:hypothetical protein JX266_010094 [Neoarthrinium moseri]|nr:hypothetical protein JX266_010094 [Neoarthrinium moseri]
MTRLDDRAGQVHDGSQQANDTRAMGSPLSGDITAEISQLARRLTMEANFTTSTPNILKPEPESVLDPQCPVFDARAWVKSFVDLFESDPNSAPSRKLGVAFRNLSVSGSSTGAKYQSSAGNVLIDAVSSLAGCFGRNAHEKETQILRDFEGVVNEGELLLVLGPPGSGCSTLLKTIAGEAAGLHLSAGTEINFRGIGTEYVRSRFRGDVLYNAEVDTHLAHLTVGETLTFAAQARSTQDMPSGISRQSVSNMLRDVVMTVFGISHTFNTRVGDDFVRGVSGGERKRVSIAEAALTGAPLQCWDNSTRGLDSANAVKFCQSLRSQADYLNIAALVAIYQAPQSAYELFDRVILLYEGRQIYFGKVGEAKQYFEELGFECPDRQTTPDFLTSMTSANERRVRLGYEHLAPRSAEEFADRWQKSKQRHELLQEIEDYQLKHSPSDRLLEYKVSRSAEQARGQPSRSPYTISYTEQVSLNIRRGWRRLLADPSFTVASLFFNLVIALMLGSMFYNLKSDSSSFYYRGGLVFFSLLFNAFASQLEVLTVYAERPVVEKHHKYAFYSQSTQAIASYLLDLPYKTINMLIFNVTIYFMANLRREAGNFFFFCLVSYLTTLVMSSIYRTLACLTRTPAQAMVPSAILSLGLIIYAGFCIPPSYLPGWSGWMNNINPLSYAFESLMANEFHNRLFECASMVPQGPGYGNLPSDSQICSVVGAEVGATSVNGDRYIGQAFNYYNSNKWRNVGILVAYLVGFFIAYVVSAEFSKPPMSKGEVLVFRRNQVPRKAQNAEMDDAESQHSSIPMAVINEEKPSGSINLTKSTSVFHWEDLCYDVQIKSETRRILDHVDGWVKPGTSTALMGVSGAGKTTLLDVLATRVTMGVVSGDTLIDGKPTDPSFQHCVGYVQQRDIHLNTMTVREALQFSAVLRQPATFSRAEKLAYVEDVIAMLDMQEFAGAVIGVPGEGLNVEQRKRLTIGVELAARPELLVFLDEPTSGLDSQTSWSICDLIEKLTSSGQAILCTIHQPSSMLFQRFDRLLLLAAGGKTVYFGEIGENARTLIQYMQRSGALTCPPEANPAEWMLETIQPPADGSAGINWFQSWRDSPEYTAVKSELARLRGRSAIVSEDSRNEDPSQQEEFVTSFWVQLWEVLLRTSKHFWRSPTYIWSKIILVSISSLYLGFSFSANNSIQGLQNQLYAIYMFLVLFGNINEQIMPMFVPQRDLYEAKERPSKMYRWTAFLLSNIFVEIAWNTLMAAIAYFCWYYPVGFVQNAGSDGDEVAIRGFLVFLFMWKFMLFTSTFSHFAIVWIETSETAGVLATLLWMFCISFCGIGVTPSDLPSFWQFMYCVSPATYLVSGIMSSALSGGTVTCSVEETLHVNPPTTNMTCGDFLGPFAEATGGIVLNPMAMETCSYCSIATTDGYLARFEIFYADRWRNEGLLWVYILVNILLALGLYWLFRVPKAKGLKRAN